MIPTVTFILGMQLLGLFSILGIIGFVLYGAYAQSKDTEKNSS